jgi:hypothetical protein
MNTTSRRLIIIIIMLALVSLAAVNAGPKSHPLNEDAALNLLSRTLKHDNVYAKRIKFDCLAFGIEETTRIYFEFVVRENHNAKCGGDPDFSPAIDRYRVSRASGKIEWLERVADSWQPYNPAKIR